MPGGRYIVDILDTRTDAWVSRESAAGGAARRRPAGDRRRARRAGRTGGGRHLHARGRTSVTKPAAEPRGRCAVGRHPAAGHRRRRDRRCCRRRPGLPEHAPRRPHRTRDLASRASCRSRPTSAALRGTAGDTPVFELRGREPGGTMLVLGGTHADEPAGYLAAVLLVERARVDAGRLLVMPRANASGFTHNYPQEGHPVVLRARHARRPATLHLRRARHQPGPPVARPAGLHARRFRSDALGLRDAEPEPRVSRQAPTAR